MNKPLLIILVIVNIPFYGMMASLLFGRQGIIQAVKYFSIPELFSALKGEFWDDKWAELMLIIWVVMGLLFPWAFRSVSLVTVVRYDGLHVRFTLFQRKGKIISYNDIQEYEIRTYSPYREYGGYGVRFGAQGKGKAYNVSGNKGMQLALTGDKKFLIGTQKPDQFFSALDSAFRSFRG